MRNSIITSLCTPTTGLVVGDSSVDGKWGQSNQVGFSGVNPTDPKYNNPAVDALILSDSMIWETLTINTNKGVTHGSELSYAFEKGECKMVKVAQGSTGLSEHWYVGSTLKTTLINHLKRATNANNYPNRIVRIFQNQWERDTLLLTTANAYYANMVTFYTDLQNEIGKNISDVVILLPKANAYHAITYPIETAIVKQAILDFANNFGAKVINQDDLPLRGDQAHLTSDGYITLGQREHSQTLLPNVFSI